MATAEPRLPRTALPPPDVRSAHAVRLLRPCAHAGCPLKFGSSPHMIRRGAGKVVEFFHGRCFIKAHGMVAFLRLPTEELGKVSLADVGGDAMLAAMDVISKRGA